MHEIDWPILKGLHSLRSGLDALLNVRQTAGDRYTTAKAVLDAEWQAALQPVMEDLYWHPLRNGIDATPDDEGELRTWLEDRYHDAAVVAALLLLLRRYSVKAYNLGGQTGLDMLLLDGTFDLTDPDLLAMIDAHARELTTVDGEFSLIDTTIDDLVVEIPKAKAVAGSTALSLAAYIALRSARRTEAIERTERPLQVANALTETFVNNGIAYQMYDVNGVGCPKICAPLHGIVMPTNRIPAYLSLPQHPFCDCVYSPVMDEYNPPGQVWTGGIVP